ncbi:MAG TPA: EAL domain-containing protein [Egibacteraceae bacterium]|nr:EAL domain-containing protein [Egibacteraceae bacterium]
MVALRDPDLLAQTVVDSLVDDFGAALARIWLYDPDTGLLHLGASAGLETAPDESGVDLTTYPWLLGDASQSPQPYVTNDPTAIAQFEQPLLEESRVRALGAFSLAIGGDFQGMLAYFARDPLREDVVEVLTSFATTVGALISQQRVLREAQRATRDKEQSLALLDTLFTASPAGLGFWDTNLRNVRVNEALAAMHDLPVEAYHGRTPSELLGTLGEDVELLFRHVLDSGEPLTDFEATVKNASGRSRHWVVNYYPVRSRQGGRLGVGMAVNEVTGLKRVEEALRESEARFRLLVEGVTDYAVYLLDPDGRVASWNAGAERITGYSADEIVGRLVGTFYPPDEAAAGAPEHRLAQAAATGRAEAQGWRLRKDGSRFWADTVITALRDLQGDLYGFSEVTRDSTERRTHELELRHQALHDPLTDLPNRILLQDRLELALREARRRRTSVALLVLDLDRFKEINDAFGHQTGDALLREVGQRLQGQLRESDTVARLGGDEFAVVLPGLADPADGSRLARKLLAALQQPVAVCGHHLDVSASIGVATFPDQAVDAGVLMQRADAAMYTAKRLALGYARYSDDLVEDGAPLPAASDELAHAITAGQLFLVFQPKLHLATGRVSAMEALVRWRHPQRGVLGPQEFIPLAHRSGLIQPLTRWVLDAALDQCRAWQRQGRAYAVAVNVSTRDVHDHALEETVVAALAHADVTPRNLELEITENEIMWDPEAAAATVKRLGDVGVRFAVDDFGTGYSSLAYLKRLRVHELKIDRSFIADLVTDPRDASIVRSIVELGHNLALRVVAEGVETREVCALLRDLGCEHAQGYYLRRPLPADEAARALPPGLLPD